VSQKVERADKCIGLSTERSLVQVTCCCV